MSSYPRSIQHSQAQNDFALERRVCFLLAIINQGSNTCVFYLTSLFRWQFLSTTNCLLDLNQTSSRRQGREHFHRDALRYSPAVKSGLIFFLIYLCLGKCKGQCSLPKINCWEGTKTRMHTSPSKIFIAESWMLWSKTYHKGMF